MTTRTTPAETTPADVALGPAPTLVAPAATRHVEPVQTVAEDGEEYDDDRLPPTGASPGFNPVAQALDTTRDEGIDASSFEVLWPVARKLTWGLLSMGVRNAPNTRGVSLVLGFLGMVLSSLVGGALVVFILLWYEARRFARRKSRPTLRAACVFVPSQLVLTYAAMAIDASVLNGGDAGGWVAPLSDSIRRLRPPFGLAEAVSGFDLVGLAVCVPLSFALLHQMRLYVIDGRECRRHLGVAVSALPVMLPALLRQGIAVLGLLGIVTIAYVHAMHRELWLRVL